MTSDCLSKFKVPTYNTAEAWREYGKLVRSVRNFYHLHIFAVIQWGTRWAAGYLAVTHGTKRSSTFFVESLMIMDGFFGKHPVRRRYFGKCVRIIWCNIFKLIAVIQLKNTSYDDSVMNLGGLDCENLLAKSRQFNYCRMLSVYFCSELYTTLFYSLWRVVTPRPTPAFFFAEE